MTIEQLDQIYKLNNYAIATADVGLRIVKVNLSCACVVGFGDSSWGNADQHRAQKGLIVLITDSTANDISARLRGRQAVCENATSCEKHTRGRSGGGRRLRRPCLLHGCLP